MHPPEWAENERSGKLKLLQDVKTRWNSTYIMLVRCIRLRSAVSHYMVHETDRGAPALRLSDVEWKMVEYLVELLKPFATHGAALSVSTRPSIHIVWEKYNSLFEHLEKEKTKLARKLHDWKQSLVDALKAGYAKLSEYYAKTTGALEELYNIGNMLNPSAKDKTYTRLEWEGGFQVRYTAEFKKTFRELYGGERTTQPAEAPCPPRRSLDVYDISRIEPGAGQGSGSQSEVDRYLSEGKYLFFFI